MCRCCFSFHEKITLSNDEASEIIREEIIDKTISKTKSKENNDSDFYYEAEVRYGDGAVVYDNNAKIIP